MSFLLQGRKRGMTQVFDDQGNLQVCTVLEVEKNVITQLKTADSDGYCAAQLGFEKHKNSNEKVLRKRVTKPLLGHFSKNEIEPRRFLAETRLDSVEGLAVGQEVSVSQFSAGDLVDVTAQSKGKGYQGVVKLHGFKGIGASHGAGPVHRHAGSTGNRSTPGRCFPNGKRASQMGNRRVTVERLRVLRVDEDKNLLLVHGSVPGARNAYVKIRKAVKEKK